nr:HPP family protein [Bacillus cereus group sp. BfR-BA-01380]
MKGTGTSTLKINMHDVALGFIGGFLTIAILAYLTTFTSTPWLMAPFGASCVLAFGLWNAPLSQPRNIIGGHIISTLVGISLYQLFGNEPWVIALGVATAISCMMLTKTTHPPAGANPIVVILTGSSWHYLFSPVLIGTIVIVIIALLVNNLNHNRQYPTFWV